MSTAMQALMRIDASMARELAVAQRVCVRPIVRSVLDRESGSEQRVAIPCGSTREDVCPSCAQKARVLRMQQCAEGWHRSDEPERDPTGAVDPAADDAVDEFDGAGDRRVRSTRRRQDSPDLPWVPVEDRTVGRTFEAPDGRVYRPSMFLTVTLPSYGPVTKSGVPVDPESYDYRRAALDALHFPRLVDRLWQNLRRCAGYRVQYFAAVEPQRRLAPHLHSALRGAIPRSLLRQVVRATYFQLWWPRFDRPVFDQRMPVWNGEDYMDADTGEVLPTWDQALDELDADEDSRPAHVVRFGRQLDLQGIVAPSPDADRAVRYLTKYLTKSISGAHRVDGEAEPGYEAHLDRLHEQLRWLPCSPRCANWLRYGIQPAGRGPGLRPGWCASRAHDRENAGLGGRRVLVSRQWSGKTLQRHRADRAEVVREALLSAGYEAVDVERMAADVKLPDGSPRFIWSDVAPDPRLYVRVLLTAVAERTRWRTAYEAAKATRGPVCGDSATDGPSP